MINLIPPEGHTILKREYILRVCATFSFLFTGAIVLLTVALVPTYVLISAQINALVLEADRAHADDTTFQDADKEVKKTKLVLAQLKTTSSVTLISTVLKAIDASAPPAISFKSFVAESVKGFPEKVYVQGTAPRREDLIRFKNALEATDLFEKAEVPIADLARDVNVPFAITITLARKQQ